MVNEIEEVVFVWKSCKLYYDKRDLEDFPSGLFAGVKLPDVVQVDSAMFKRLEDYGKFWMEELK